MWSYSEPHAPQVFKVEVYDSITHKVYTFDQTGNDKLQAECRAIDRLIEQLGHDAPTMDCLPLYVRKIKTGTQLPLF